MKSAHWIEFRPVGSSCSQNTCGYGWMAASHTRVRGLVPPVRGWMREEICGLQLEMP